MIKNLRTGSIEIVQEGDDYKLTCADPLVLISPALLLELARTGLVTAESEHVLLIAGQARYQLVTVDSGRNLLLQRIDGDLG